MINNMHFVVNDTTIFVLQKCSPILKKLQRKNIVHRTNMANNTIFIIFVSHLVCFNNSTPNLQL